MIRVRRAAPTDAPALVALAEAVAREDGQGWRLLGVLPLHDPPRDDSAVTIAEAAQLGFDGGVLFAHGEEMCP